MASDDATLTLDLTFKEEMERRGHWMGRMWMVQLLGSIELERSMKHPSCFNSHNS